MDLGQYLKQERKRQNLRLADLVDKTRGYVSIGSLSAWERGGYTNAKIMKLDSALYHLGVSYTINPEGEDLDVNGHGIGIAIRCGLSRRGWSQYKLEEVSGWSVRTIRKAIRCGDTAYVIAEDLLTALGYRYTFGKVAIENV